jgi:hypothetical protein
MQRVLGVVSELEFLDVEEGVSEKKWCAKTPVLKKHPLLWTKPDR